MRENVSVFMNFPTQISINVVQISTNQFRSKELINLAAEFSILKLLDHRLYIQYIDDIWMLFIVVTLQHACNIVRVKLTVVQSDLLIHCLSMLIHRVIV